MTMLPLAREMLSSPMGRLSLAVSNRGLLELQLRAHESRRLPLGITNGTDPKAATLIEQARGEIAAYFDGHLRTFSVPVDPRLGTDFQRKVWANLLDIPYGETRSYGEVAEAVGRPEGARAVGQAVGSNPVPLVIPCHRVIASDGSLGGFGPGLDLKRWLLQHERGENLPTPPPRA